MEGTHGAGRYLSSDSTRSAYPDSSARQVPTILRGRPRGGDRARRACRRARRGSTDLACASDPAVRSRPVAGNRQRLVERDLPQRLPDAGNRHPRRPEHPRRESARAAADLRGRASAGPDEPAGPAQADTGLRAAHPGLVRASRADESHAAAGAAAWPVSKPEQKPCSERPQCRTVAPDAAPAAGETAEFIAQAAGFAAAPGATAAHEQARADIEHATTSHAPRPGDGGQRRLAGQAVRRE